MGWRGVGKMQGVLLGGGCCGDGGLHLEMALNGSWVARGSADMISRLWGSIAQQKGTR